MELRKCPVCCGKLRSEALGWICYDCKGFIDMQGFFHEHKEKPFMPPMTNADRIRAMSDEQLAKHFSGLICDINEGVEYHANPNRWLEWLRQPVEDK